MRITVPDWVIKIELQSEAYLVSVVIARAFIVHDAEMQVDQAQVTLRCWGKLVWRDFRNALPSDVSHLPNEHIVEVLMLHKISIECAWATSYASQLWQCKAFICMCRAKP